ncbi:MAG: glycosyltransferase family A protein [Pyrinomonadaceae bacterium]
MEKAPVSVVIPAYNSRRYIGEAIESVLRQTLPVSEIIVVDNNCTDGTQLIAKELGAKLVYQQIQGASAARNRGIEAARGPWIAFLDADDIWDKQKIAEQWQALEKFPEARIVLSDFGFLIEPGPKIISPEPGKKPEIDDPERLIIDGDYSFCPAYTNDLFEWFLMMTPTTIFHREVFQTVGQFDESFPLAQDLEFFQRALARFPAVTVKKNLAYIRKHEDNRSNDQRALMEMQIRVAEKMLESSEDYPPGSGEFFRERMKRTFLARAEDKGKTGNPQ